MAVKIRLRRMGAKKTAAILAMLLLFALLAGCGRQAAETAGDPTEEMTTTVTEETEPITEPETATEEPETTTEATVPATTTTKATTTTAKPESQAEATEKPTTATTTTTTTTTSTTTTSTAPPADGTLAGHNKEFFDLFKKYIPAFKDPTSIRIIEVEYVVSRMYNITSEPFYVVLLTAKNSFGAASQTYYYISTTSVDDESDLSYLITSAVRGYINDPSKTHYTYDIKAINVAVQDYLEERGYI